MSLLLYFLHDDPRTSTNKYSTKPIFNKCFKHSVFQTRRMHTIFTSSSLFNLRKYKQRTPGIPNDHWSSDVSFNPRPTRGGGAISSPLDLLRYLLNQCKLSPPNLQYPLSQQCCTFHCVKISKPRLSYFGHKWRQSDVMFRRFQPKIRPYGNRRHRCSFKATINCLIWNDVELVGL